MQHILKSCEPRKDILTGTFNPEIFTASLAEVTRFYQTNQAGVHSSYTDAAQFFTEGTYPTDGTKTVLNEVFAHLAGDATAPAIHRLETAFGGGKTHTLIACTHVGYKGDEITPHISQLVEPKWIPRKGEVHVVGIAGNEIPVHKPRGTKLIPYTLWGEIAFQMGGEELYRKNSSLLPDEASRDDFYDRMVSHYPFHPTFIDFLNHKLASYENFQGTRGILRILALAVRTLWEKNLKSP